MPRLLPRPRVCMHRELIAPCERPDPLDVVCVLMRNQDPIQRLRCTINIPQPSLNLPCTQPGIDQDAGFRGFDIRAVPFTATSQDTHTQGHLAWISHHWSNPASRKLMYPGLPVPMIM